MTPEQFPACFQQLTDHPPFRWQQRLFERLCAGGIPPRCDLPTGLGKTSVLAIWLLALAEQARRLGNAVTLPRRLAYIVDRRVVVDQATTEARKMQAALAGPTADEPLAAVEEALRGLTASEGGPAFELSTLRGALADNRRWSSDPARPAIIVGTVDMIGSRLLFGGYGGLGRYGRSQHAALLGQDALIVLDEAQLAPALMTTLAEIERRARSEAGELRRPFAVMSLTATQPRRFAPSDQNEEEKPAFTLVEEDFLDGEVRRRIVAPKALRLIAPVAGTPGKADADSLAAPMAAKAVELAGTASAVVIFVNTVTALDKIYSALITTHGVPKQHCLRFNGQMRGQERDATFSDGRSQHEVFKALREPHPRAARGYPVFLIATSAGEVGVNFDADHAVCDLVSLERMAQRFGRVNRFGHGSAQICVFLAADPEDLQDEFKATYKLLSELPESVGPDGLPAPDVRSASPEALRPVLARANPLTSYTPFSDPPPLDTARLDDWALTSLDQEDFPRPQVSYWLRGITPDSDQNVTRLVWREELRHAASESDAADMALTVPPAPREIVQLPTYRAAKWLLARARHHLGARRYEDDPSHGRFVAVRVAGQWEGWPIALERFEDKDRLEREIAGATLVLPTTFGGLSEEGLPEESSDTRVPDVLEVATGEPQAVRTVRRALLRGSDEAGWSAYPLPLETETGRLKVGASYTEIIPKLAAAFSEQENGRRYRLRSRKYEPVEIDAEDDGTTPTSDRIEYFVTTGTGDATDEDGNSLRGKKEVLLEDHRREARETATRIVARLDLPEPIRRAVVQAADWHDLGKNRPGWQRAVGNMDPSRPWAKSPTPRFDHRWTEGYRHEFGSLMEATEQPEFSSLAEPDLVLHLIAAHHGHGRPGFAENAYDVPKYLQRQCREAAEEAELRYERLQRRFGWWGLAYLEALVKCADGLASDAADPEPPVPPAPLTQPLPPPNP